MQSFIDPLNHPLDQATYPLITVENSEDYQQDWIPDVNIEITRIVFISGP